MRAGNELPSAAYETDLKRTISSGAQAAGAGQQRADVIGEKAGTVANIAAQVGPVGTVLSAQDIPHHLGEVVTRAKAGDYSGAASSVGEAALAGVGAIPGARGVKLGVKAAREARAAKQVERGGRGLPYRSVDDTVEEARRSMATPQPSRGYEPGEQRAVERQAGEGPAPEPRVPVPEAPETLREAVVNARKGFKGKGGAIAQSGLRDMSLDEAIQKVRKGEHLQAREADGSFVGAPHYMKDEATLNRVRSEFDESVRIGNMIGGDQWYSEGRGVVKELTRGDPKEGRRFAGGLGPTSAQATPETNLGFELGAHNAWEMGEPRSIVRTKTVAEKLNKARDLDVDIKQGPKTDIYQTNLDPNLPWSTTGTNDIWHARALGYTHADGKPWGGDRTPARCDRRLDGNACGLRGRQGIELH
jgi:hypothetical protein